MAVVKTWSCVVALTVGGLATKTTTSTRTSHIWIFDNEKQYFCTLWTCIFHFKHFADVLVLSSTWNDLYYSCVDIVSIWWQMFNFILVSLRRWFQFNSRIVRTHFASVMTLNYRETVARTRSYIFRVTLSQSSTSSLPKLSSFAPSLSQSVSTINSRGLQLYPNLNDSFRRCHLALHYNNARTGSRGLWWRRSGFPEINQLRVWFRHEKSQVMSTLIYFMRQTHERDTTFWRVVLIICSFWCLFTFIVVSPGFFSALIKLVFFAGVVGPCPNLALHYCLLTVSSLPSS